MYVYKYTGASKEISQDNVTQNINKQLSKITDTGNYENVCPFTGTALNNQEEMILNRVQ